MRTNRKTNLRTALQTKIRRFLYALGCCSLLAGLVIQPAQAAEFDPVDLTEASLQSRSFEQVRLDLLVSACLSVIQDIGFHVVETESAPVVIVATARGRGFYTLTINLQPVDGNTDEYRVRLLLDSPYRHSGMFGQPGGLAGQADFYQDFFNHLNKTYFTERAMP
jgi:hypothetical protein